MAEPRRIDPLHPATRRNGRCYRGHEMTPENTYVMASGYTRCRTCHKMGEREAYPRRKARRAREKANG